jgi:KUP system potassium uptake protein
VSIAVTADTSQHHAAPSGSLGALALGALGVVFGDIGTSPLYTLKTALQWAGGATPDVALGLLSLVFWTLLIVTSLKYVAIVMRIDNDGEGGIMALMALLSGKNASRLGVAVIGLMGAALLYGDGAITPAISVLSALEGLKAPLPALAPYVLPLSVAVLIGLFILQAQGTARIGKLFGPVMVFWFLTIGVLGLSGILRHPEVLVAADPLYGLDYLFGHGFTGFEVLGGVFLCATGAEALYADMGHFGAKPIRLTWYGLVLPTLLLSYAGQTALVVEGAVPKDGNPFFLLCPASLQIPLVLLATVATIIASQAIISGAFSMTRQAIQLGWCPRMVVTQTSAEGYGQIYVGFVNWALMVVTLALALGFGSSDNLASAFGIAVSLTMLLTTLLLFLAMREIWGWGLFKAGAAVALFLVVDLSFVTANLVKVLDGGWVPLLTAFVVFGLMMIWHRGIIGLARRIESQAVPFDDFLRKLKDDGVARVPGTAVFLTRSSKGTPPVLNWHVRANHALQHEVIALNVRTEPVPWLPDDARMSVEVLGEGMRRINARYGFMQTPHIAALIDKLRDEEAEMSCTDVIYYVGRETVLTGKGRGLLSAARSRIFAFMERNSAHVGDLLDLPSERVFEIGRQVKI